MNDVMERIYEIFTLVNKTREGKARLPQPMAGGRGLTLEANYGSGATGNKM